MYWREDFSLLRETKDGPAQLTNFWAEIIKESTYHDGDRTRTMLTMKGWQGDPEEPTEFPPVTIPATDFASMSWVNEKWGMRPIIYPVSNAERDVKTAIQIASAPETEHIYTHIGWDEIDGEPIYLTTTGGIGKNGLNPTIKVQLPQELQRFAMPTPVASKEAFANSIRLVNLGPKGPMWCLLLATYRAAVGSADFAIHLAGRTGTFKSEISSLFQSHYGAGMDARHLPASWSSTANALECLAYRAANALMTVDDFVPVGTSWAQRSLQAKADQFIRGQGNQSGRSRLTDTSNMQTTYYPRGIVLSTGEDIPEGHSVRARMMIVELAPGDIDAAKLTAAQALRNTYAVAMADWIKWLAETGYGRTLKTMANDIRDRHIGTGHSRTPPIIGDLVATLHLLCAYAVDRGFFTDEQLVPIRNKAEEDIVAQGQRQAEYLTSADPINSILETIRNLLNQQQAHVKTKSGGIPQDPTKYGWTVQQGQGELPTYKSNGPRIGWIDADENGFYLDPSSLPLLKKHSGGKIAVTEQTLMKRLKEAGKLTKTDTARQRNTVRMNVENHNHNCLCMALDEVMDDLDG